MGRTSKAKVEVTKLEESSVKPAVGKSGKVPISIDAPEVSARPESRKIKREDHAKAAMAGEAKSGCRKTSTGSNADTSKALSALGRLLNDKKKKAAAAKVEKAESESSEESDLEVDVKSDKDNLIAEKIDAAARLMKNMKGGEDDSGATPKWGETHFKRNGPVEHGLKVEELLDSVVPDTADIWSEASLKLRAMEESTAEAKQEVVKLLLTGASLRAHIFSRLSVDSKTLNWLFNLVCYSEEDGIERAAFSLLADIIGGSSKMSALAGVSDAYLTTSACGASFLERQQEQRVDLGWVPNLKDFRKVFDAYGYTEEPPVVATSDSNDSVGEGEAGTSGNGKADEEQQQRIPPNICSVLRLVTVCAFARSTSGTFSAKDAEALLVLLARASLDRQLYCASEPLRAALQALTDCFTEGEWETVGPRLAGKLARLSSQYINNVHVALSWPGASARSRDLQRSLALTVLTDLFKKPRVEKSEQGIVSLFKSVNFREADCVVMLSQLRLADVYLLNSPNLDEDDETFENWAHILKLVLDRVKHIDPRPGAGEVRELASFMKTKYEH